MPVLTEEQIDIRTPTGTGGGDGDSGGNGQDASDSALPISSAQLGLWLFLAAVMMLFAGFTSAYVIHRSGPAWQLIPMPKILWLNTSILLLSSGTMELARRAIKRGETAALKRWLSATTILGLGFLAGQLEAWRELVNAGVYLPTNLRSSFFYVLTGAHGLHLLGGVVALVFVLFQALRGRYTRARHNAVSLCALYWHFLDGLWAYLFVMFLAI